MTKGTLRVCRPIGRKRFPTVTPLFLEKEVSLVKPKIISAVGSTVEYWVKRFVEDEYYLQQLLHPAGRRSGFRDEHYRVIYFWILAKALYKTGIMDAVEASRLAKTFLDKFENGQTNKIKNI